MLVDIHYINSFPKSILPNPRNNIDLVEITKTDNTHLKADERKTEMRIKNCIAHNQCVNIRAMKIKVRRDSASCLVDEYRINYVFTSVTMLKVNKVPGLWMLII